MVENILTKFSVLKTDLASVKEIRFLAVVKMDDLTDRWSLLFGLYDSKSLDARKALFTRIRNIVVERLSDEDMQNIARIGLFDETDHIVSDLLKFTEDEELINVKANGNIIHEGIVVISKNKKKRLIDRTITTIPR